MERLRFSRDMTTASRTSCATTCSTTAGVERRRRAAGSSGRGCGRDRDLFDLRIADNVGNGLKTGFPHYLPELRARVDATLEAEEALSVRDLEVDGTDVMQALDLSPAPRWEGSWSSSSRRCWNTPRGTAASGFLERIRQGFSVDTRGSGT